MIAFTLSRTTAKDKRMRNFLFDTTNVLSIPLLHQCSTALFAFLHN